MLLSPLAAQNVHPSATARANEAASAARSAGSQLSSGPPHDQLPTLTPAATRSSVTSCMPPDALGPKQIVMSAALPVNHHQVNAMVGSRSSMFSTLLSWSEGLFVAPPTVRIVRVGANMPQSATEFARSCCT